MILLASNHFWRCITRASASCLKLLTRFVHIGETKVDKLQSLCSTLKEEILWLQIPVNDTVLVEMLNS